MGPGSFLDAASYPSVPGFPTILFHETGYSLHTLDGDDDMLTAMARELVKNKGIGESADHIWKSIGQLRPAPAVLAAEESNPPAEGIEVNAPAALPLTVDPFPGAALLDPVTSSRRSSRKTTETGQLSLF